MHDCKGPIRTRKKADQCKFSSTVNIRNEFEKMKTEIGNLNDKLRTLVAQRGDEGQLKINNNSIFLQT